MTYNTDIHAFAPIPSGALPTEQELSQLVARGRKRQIDFLMKSMRRVFKG